MLFDQITIIGVGLIGGSVALAAKTRGLARRVVGVDRDAESLKQAETLGVIDVGTTNMVEGVREANLVVVCTPVDLIAAVIQSAAPHVRSGTIFTDGGSTKEKIVRDLAGKLPNQVHYVPAHPLAGAEKNGVGSARGELFEKRVTIIVGGGDNSAVQQVSAFWESLGSRIVQMNAADHDRILAVTSHLPHAMASAVAGATPREWLAFSAGGFRDVTRIAAGDPRLWAAIFEANRDAVLAALGTFTDRLNEFQTLLAAGDRAGLERWLSEGKQVRDALGT